MCTGKEAPRILDSVRKLRGDMSMIKEVAILESQGLVRSRERAYCHSGLSAPCCHHVGEQKEASVA